MSQNYWSICWFYCTLFNQRGYVTSNYLIQEGAYGVGRGRFGYSNCCTYQFSMTVLDIIRCTDSFVGFMFRIPCPWFPFVSSEAAQMTSCTWVKIAVYSLTGKEVLMCDGYGLLKFLPVKCKFGGRVQHGQHANEIIELPLGTQHF